eukprot:gnl/MRDRNA2_/MRDRNA2_108576_c0_seq1.p1 gnl/MRDRNA2_/MRDRNA2_108576_c0~~gnl/MRDRNA2_/MRDRNA2_108576_c0_seq1.p1  ORF type:complete len:218 (+),score=29.82 gnl/MRDRNA2_/MRDRNA2_108576_c0_seq1:89-742(+)
MADAELGHGILQCLQYQPFRSEASRRIRSAKATTATNFRPLNMPSLYASGSAPSIPNPGASPPRSKSKPPALPAFSGPTAAGSFFGRMTGPQRVEASQMLGGASCAPGPGHYDISSNDDRSMSSSPSRFKFVRHEYLKKSSQDIGSSLPGPGAYEMPRFGRDARGPSVQTEHQCFLSSEVRFGLGERSPGKVRRVLRHDDSGRGPSSILIQAIEPRA